LTQSAQFPLTCAFSLQPPGGIRDGEGTRQLFFLGGKSKVSIVKPVQGQTIPVVNGGSNKIDVVLSISGRLSRVTLSVDGKETMKHDPCFLWFPCLRGQTTLSMDVSALADGPHQIQARGYKGVFGGQTVKSDPVSIIMVKSVNAPSPVPPPPTVPDLSRPPTLAPLPSPQSPIPPPLIQSPVSPVAAPAPPYVNAFLNSTFVPPFKKKAENSIVEHEGELYQVNASVTIIETGVIALAAARNMIERVTCSGNGTIHIQFRSEIDSAFIQRMFPNGTVLAVDGSIFGSCFVGAPEDLMGFNGTNKTDIFANNTEDGYIFIDTAIVGTDKHEVRVTGQPASFFFMFDEADINMTKLDVNTTEADRIRRLLKVEQFIGKTFPAAELQDRFKLYAGVRLLIEANVNFSVSSRNYTL
jgi:3D (Asp-Asp-Asp) domain-containing protein